MLYGFLSTVDKSQYNDACTNNVARKTQFLYSELKTCMTNSKHSKNWYIWVNDIKMEDTVAQWKWNYDHSNDLSVTYEVCHNNLLKSQPFISSKSVKVKTAGKSLDYKTSGNRFSMWFVLIDFFSLKEHIWVLKVKLEGA